VVPIAGTSEYPTAMVVNNKMPVNSVKEFIAYAKERPGKLTFGSTGVGAMDYLAGELFYAEDRHQHGARALSRRAAGVERSAGRPDRHHHRGLSGGDGADPLGRDQRASR
jgi:hypothetical protein